MRAKQPLFSRLYQQAKPYLHALRIELSVALGLITTILLVTWIQSPAELTQPGVSSKVLGEIASSQNLSTNEARLPEKAGMTLNPKLAKVSSTHEMDGGESTPVAPKPVIAPSSVVKTNWLTLTIKPGDSLAKVFAKQGISAKQLHHIMRSGKAVKRLEKIRPGDQIKIQFAKDKAVKHLTYRSSPLEILHVKAQSEQRFVANVETLKPEISYQFRQATIEDSLFLAAHRAGVSGGLTMALAGIFGWDIDFVYDIRAGDRFSMLHEVHTLEGEVISEGPILSAEFINRSRKLQAIRYVTPDGKASYYTPDGKNLKKAFLRSPVDFARISSHFNLKRKHPVLHRFRAHKGTDYAASRGTPVKASGQGKVVHLGRKGGYGRTVVLQHGQTYTTLYAHLNSYAKKLRKGSRVKQGQIIGYVGSSGLATGPHLHYEFRVNGVPRNPVTVKLPDAEPIVAAYRKQFMLHSNKWLNQLAIYQKDFQVALSGNAP